MGDGRFITVEGIEGAGKTTAIDIIRDWVKGQGGDPRLTREPGGTDLGEELREVLLRHRDEGMSAEAEVLLMFAARAEHLERVIRPALATGQWVICDRFTDASVAYQGMGRGLGIDRVRSLGEWTHADLAPDLTLWLDLPVALGLERAAGRSLPDRFESERAGFFEAVRRGYAAIAADEPDRVRRVDSSGPPAEVRDGIIAALEARFGG
ncbi:dTMP kinase [Spiribacter onubensis]|uniref:Thymidylate kinase n=1 Tax=Spiribacter onubensis TaxID=3122420 RepID=A0ABV3S806_9GAMM